MDQSSEKDIILYTSKWCAQSMRVEGFLNRNEIDVNKINIDGDSEARARLIEINEGFASVPTLVFSDGSKLTEPSFAQLRKKLSLESSPGLMDRVRGLIGQNDRGSKT
jgi:mycoredoxin